MDWVRCEPKNVATFLLDVSLFCTPQAATVVLRYTLILGLFQLSYFELWAFATQYLISRLSIFGIHIFVMRLESAKVLLQRAMDTCRKVQALDREKRLARA